MNILVCITHVPDTTSKISFVNEGTQFNTANVQFIIGPYDEYALARAVELKESIGGTLTVLNVGGLETEPSLRKALAIGADDAIRVNSAPRDGYFVAKQIEAIVLKNKYDLILMGRESIDYNGNQVHGMLGALLGIPSISQVMKLEFTGSKALISREIEGGKEEIEVELPFIAGCQEPIAEWKIPSMRGIMSARTKPLVVVEPVEANDDIRSISYEMPPAKTSVKLIDPAQPEKLFELLKNEAKVL